MSYGLKAAGLAMAGVMMMGGAAMAQVGPQDAAPRGKRAGDIVIGLGAIGVVPTNGGGTVDLIGGRPHASASATPQLDVSYFFTPNLAVNLIAATSRHDLRVNNSALGNVNLGRVWALPPTLTFQYHPLPASRISPYVGVGVNTTFFYGYGGAMTAPVNRVRVGTTAGIALNAGVDYEITPNWLANLDVKFITMQPGVSVNSGLIHARANLNPVVIGASVRYRF
ncbi:OmpW/AlkL family protein [Rhodovarius crocodyli]|nr:OmpW family outer membrane protein [Rhodovarius crocodyli]